jgi:hypothetical protein
MERSSAIAMRSGDPASVAAEGVILELAISARSARRALENRGGVSIAQAAAVVMRLISLNAATLSTIRAFENLGKSGKPLRGWWSVVGCWLLVVGCC